MADLIIKIPMLDGTDETVHIPFRVTKANIAKARQGAHYVLALLSPSYDMHWRAAMKIHEERLNECNTNLRTGRNT